MSTPKTPTAVVFDLGGVLIDWDPRYLYRQLMPEDEVDAFLAEVGFQAWNHAQDAGGPWGRRRSRSCAARHPHRRELIAAYPARFPETLGGPVEGTVAMLERAARGRHPAAGPDQLVGRDFPHAEAAFDFLALFEGIVVSGGRGRRQARPGGVPTSCSSRYRLDPARTVFVDDSPANVAAAAAAGLVGAGLHRPRPAARRPQPARACSTVPDQADAVAHGQHHHLDPVVGAHVVVERRDGRGVRRR